MLSAPRQNMPAPSAWAWHPDRHHARSIARPLKQNSSRTTAFSLVEVVVAIGILALMMSLAGEVMSLTVRATGKARALTTVNQAIRAFERALREDLAGVVPGSSIMVIQGNPINAYWTQAQRDGDDNGDPRDGYPHNPDPQRTDPNDPTKLERPRADILMFFTTGKQVTNYVQYKYAGLIPQEYRQGVPSGVQQVVYGHAELGDYVPNSAGASPPIVFEPDLTANPDRTMFPNILAPRVAPVAAEMWHLARRSVLLTDVPPPNPPPTPNWADWVGLAPSRFDDVEILRSVTDVMARIDYEGEIVTNRIGPAPCYLPQPLFPPAVAPLKPNEGPFARSQIDPAPPPEYADRLGHYFLSRCASFKVEWALDPESDFVGGRLEGEERIFWFDPGDAGKDPTTDTDDNPLAMLTAEMDREFKAFGLSDRYQRLSELYSARLAEQGTVAYSLAERFGDKPGDPLLNWKSCGYGQTKDSRNMAVFASEGIGGSGSTIREDIFPAAVRVTIDMFDDDRRLERPIRHVIVVPVGG